MPSHAWESAAACPSITVGLPGQQELHYPPLSPAYFVLLAMQMCCAPPPPPHYSVNQSSEEPRCLAVHALVGVPVPCPAATALGLSLARGLRVPWGALRAQPAGPAPAVHRVHPAAHQPELRPGRPPLLPQVGWARVQGGDCLPVLLLLLLLLLLPPLLAAWKTLCMGCLAC